MALLMSPPHSLQDVLGRGAHKGPEEAEPEEGHVPEDDRGGPRRPHRGGERAAGSNQAPLHAVEGDHQLDRHAGLQDRGDKGEAALGVQSRGNSCWERSVTKLTHRGLHTAGWWRDRVTAGHPWSLQPDHPDQAPGPGQRCSSESAAELRASMQEDSFSHNLIKSAAWLISVTAKCRPPT